MKRFKHYIYIFSIVFALSSCSKPAESIEITPEVFHASVDKVMDIQIHDIFSPPEIIISFERSRISIKPSGCFTAKSPE